MEGGADAGARAVRRRYVNITVVLLSHSCS